MVAALDANLSFRSPGRPEFWDPLTGASRPAAFFQHQTDRTVVSVRLPAGGSVFVVFRPDAGGSAFTALRHNGVVLADVTDVRRVDSGAPQPLLGLKPTEEVQPWVDYPLAAGEIMPGGKQLLAWEPGDYQLTRADQSVVTVTAPQSHSLCVFSPWSLSFPPGWDTPAQVELPQLEPWSALTDPATRAFSGTATYASMLTVGTIGPDERLLLDLGRVAVIAEITVNGHSVATLWAPPFRADITPYVTAGTNRIAVKVTSTWYNRLAYDASLPAAKRKTWTISPPSAHAVLQPAGLIGPVGVRVGRVIPLAD